MKIFIAKSYIMKLLLVALRYCCITNSICLRSDSHKKPSEYSHDTLPNTLNNQTYQNENTAQVWDLDLTRKQEFKLFVSVLTFQCFFEKFNCLLFL